MDEGVPEPGLERAPGCGLELLFPLREHGCWDGGLRFSFFHSEDDSMGLTCGPRVTGNSERAITDYVDAEASLKADPAEGQKAGIASTADP
jgi:hypothetical protein